MKNSSLQDRIQGAVVVLVVLWFLRLTTVDSNTRLMFADFAKFVVGGYMGRLYSAPRNQNDNSDRLP
jgi:hypothetical protein